MPYFLKTFKWCYLLNLVLAGLALGSNSDSTMTLSVNKTSLESSQTQNLLSGRNNHLYNPYICGGLSAIIPGSGQLYSKNAFPALSFFGAEVIMGIATYDRYIKYSMSLNRITPLQDSIASTTLDLNSFTELRMKLDYANFEAENDRVGFLHGLTWAGGCYYFNILNALDHSGYFYSTTPRDPATAGWLATVPFASLGQLYNGSLKKAGFLSMVQVSLGVMAVNYQILMHASEQRLATFADTTTLEHAFSQKYYTQWDNQRRQSFQKRNTFLWYSVLFYFYGIFDAIVDAHLHDINEKIKLEPDLSVSEGRAGLNLLVHY